MQNPTSSPWMLILNLSPDSFSGDGLSSFEIVRRLSGLVSEEFSFLDVGAVSTRPGASSVDPEEEWKRLEPALPIIDDFIRDRKKSGRNTRISLDTSSPAVTAKALEKLPSIELINDVFAGRKREGGVTTIDIAKSAGIGIVLMHMQNEPQTMQLNPAYQNCLAEVVSFLGDRYSFAKENGVKNVYIDPGIGFGKTFDNNLELLSRTALQNYCGIFASGDTPRIVIGLSRKRFIAEWSRKASNQPIDLDPPLRDSLSKYWEQMCMDAASSIESHNPTLELYLRTHKLPSEISIDDKEVRKQ